MKRAIVWFRSDLRTADHPALSAACEEAGEVVALFAPAPEQWREHDWGDAKVDFLRRSLADHSERLADLRIPLLVRGGDRFADLPAVVAGLARELGAEAVLAHRELEVNERRRDEEVGEALAETGVAWRTFHDQTVVEPGEVLTGDGGYYKVYTPFRRAWVERVEAEGLGEPLPAPGRRDAMPVEPDPLPESFDGFSPRPELAEPWPAGEAAAGDRLERFLDGPADEYDEVRDLPAEPGTSRLSPYLALGVLSARSALAAAVAANGGELQGGSDGIDTWIRELVWREFYRHVLVGFPRVSKRRAFHEETDAGVAWRDAPDELDAWREGRTGYPIVDAGMRQLAESGWMHNRLRMITAMFLAKHLLVDWREGERHFMQRLVDGDLASNNGGWQWSASTGTDAAPYFRIFNPWTQGKRFDGDGDYIRRWVPELAEVPAAALHDAKKLARLRSDRAIDYPAPIVDHADGRERALEAFQG